ncbi:sulfite exporter TauE/SafE family protein [Streptomyces sp. ME02-6979.5a]|uniref:sulfite exporter TauE/SafE family protein n=1 Tax=Streptomyces TaxID=1883 RepID=UPI00225C29C9|nr:MULTISPECIES: sulfite exporter TauE/SafE family protein [Streptomyces]MCX4712978.1 sulfite exporter TauE/SafE family protein [Streptomyces griseus]MDX3339321.1 sulfite exporter TauE/SafE family protein [Streptomyces sp. ME02-6979.5a]
MDTISLWQLAVLAAASTLVGFSKTAVSGANTISLAVFAAVLPARESTGVLLPILIAGDLLAVRVYRRHAHWPTLLRLFPAVAVGVAAGTLFMLWADDAAVRTSIGAILLFMTGVTLWRRRIAEQEAGEGEQGMKTEAGAGAGADSGGEGGTGRTAARGYGVLGGFTTMVANAGGPVMSLYLLSAGFRKLGFLGTSAWFFLIVNVSKVPFSVGLGLIDARSLLLDACLLLFVLPGAYLGRVCVDRINQKVFDRIVIGATVAGGLQLLLI